MKESLMIDATGGTYWIGGLYYKKNIIFSILSNENICNRYNIIVVVEPENRGLFAEFKDRVKFINLKETRNKIRKLKLLGLCLLNNSKYIFPMDGKYFAPFGVMPIKWIPDFQHNHYPEFFKDSEIEIRNEEYSRVANNNIPLVLSSVDSLNDFKHYYSSDKKNIYVVHFVSYIEKELKAITPDIEKSVLDKFGLTGKNYTCVMNQFWQHKNHKVVIDAIQLFFNKNKDSSLEFVFTGNLQDHRSPEYIEEIKKVLELPTVKKHVNMLGFIERIEQLIIMKNAEFIIQPSLFEGWGTVVEDAKIFDKTMLLSNIPVHEEQKTEKCKLFDPHNAEQLAQMIEDEVLVEHVDDMELGLKRMYESAHEYSKVFESIIC